VSELLDFVRIAARAADDKKAIDTVIIDVGAVLAITDYFLITSAGNPRMVRSIAEAIEEDIKLHDGPSPRRVEGLRDLSWVLLDYGDWVAHIFSDESRKFYDLERLWKDMPRVAWAP
jgi:ribosome-associated protein